MKYLFVVPLLFLLSCASTLNLSNPLESRVRDNMRQYIIAEMDSSQFSTEFKEIKVIWAYRLAPLRPLVPFKKSSVSHVIVMTKIKIKGIATEQVPLRFFINTETSQVDSVHFNLKGRGGGYGMDGLGAYGSAILGGWDIFF